MYVTATNGKVYALSAKNGRTIWSATVAGGGAAPTSTAAYNNHLLVATNSGYITSLDAGSGKQRWAYREARHGGADIAIGDGLVFVAGAGRVEHGSILDVTALSIDTGVVRWSLSTGGSMAADPSIGNDVLYVSDNRSDLYAIAVRTGKKLRLVAHLTNYSPTYPAIVGDWLYVSNYAFSLPSTS